MRKFSGLIMSAAALLTALGMILSLTGCSVSGRTLIDTEIPDSTAGKDVERAVGVDNVFSLNCNMNYSFNPLIATNHSNQLVCNLVYENMVEVDENFNVIPNVITAWSCTEDGKTWTFTIATDHTFHDGTPLTAKDLRYSLDRSIYADRYSGRFASYQGSSYWGDDTLVVTLGIGDTQFVKLLNIPIMKSGDYPEKYPQGSGPYMYNEDYTELLAYEGYVKTSVVTTTDGDTTKTEIVSEHPDLPVDVIYLKEYDTADTILSAFENSTIDVVINDPSSYTNLGYASTDETRYYPTTNFHYVAFNQDSTLCKYSNFRFALNYAFDRSNFEGNLTGGAGTASAVPMHPNCDIYPTSTANSIAYDLDSCRIVLANAGIQDYDDDGKLEFMSGSPQDIELHFIVCSDSSSKVGVARKFAADMASLGLTVSVHELTWGKYTEALESGEFEISENKFKTWDMYYGEVKLRNNFDLTELLQVRTKDNERSNLNFTNSKDDSYVNYINAYLAASSVDRAEKYQLFAEYLINNAPIISIGFEKQEIITHRGVVKGIKANIGNPLYDFANWTIILDDE